MDFREHQDTAKRNSKIIWILYIILLLTASFLVGWTLTIGLQLVEFYAPEYRQYGFLEKFIAANRAILSSTANLQSFLSISGLALVVMFAVTIAGFLQKSNGHKVAKAFGGVLITADKPLTTLEKQALNIIHEQALAASIPTPALYIVPDQAINAFAAGKKTDEAVVALTDGALQAFNRSQLSGVVAHEIGHIVNQDIKINIHIAAFVFGFTALFFLARLIFYQSMSRRMDGRAKIMMLAIAAVIALIGILTVWFGRILQAAMSRQREYLADASAVQFTRYPDGLIGAFEVLDATNKQQTTLKNPNAKEYAHAMIFGMSNELFATHPSLKQRIARIRNRAN